MIKRRGAIVAVAFAGLLCAPAAHAVDTTITGGQMELLNKGDKVLFTGGVVLKRGTDTMKAKRMTTNKKRDQVKADGDVRLFRRVSSTETWEGSGASGFYNTEKGAGYLEGSKSAQSQITHTEILSSTMTRVIHLYADRIDFTRVPQSATATGHVVGNGVDPQTGDHFDFWSEHAFFDGDANQMTLSGTPQPIAIQTIATGRRTIKGDKITYFNQTQRVVSEGNAEAVFEDTKGTKPKK